ncbi:MAG: hypothetical protein A2086_13865 [Spirochaetes bacterium GWD1_27_9]|nr:MAG: hypothetical protein A2Z98_17125 [Spirochaetes bacterium GWB1_27_13]OHD22327.1 MAG: hypothetical protein A2Y34_05940 [Spirochaetes bacterium GWC1_27_15]OHD37947.1 MAG: hypothetical protein A2086_13865 [Spirochaetes bacterium GWD1_27_9]
MKINSIVQKHLFKILFIIIFIVIFSMILFNNVMINIRIFELKSYLLNINIEESSRDYLGLVSKYKLYKDLYKNHISENNFDINELKTSYLVTEDVKQNISLVKYSTLNYPVLFVINSIRFILGKQFIENIFTKENQSFLDIAYYMERNKHYNNAIYFYKEILKTEKMPRNKKVLVILHLGFCYSIIGEYEKAKQNYLDVINGYENENVAITAAILLEYIEDFKFEIERVKKVEQDPILKSEKLFKLIAYNDAKNILKELKDDKKSKQKEKIDFYIARCEEESGNKNAALKIYQDIILNNSKSEFSKFSNRRIFIIGSFDKNSDKIKSLAKKNNALIEDKDFTQLISIEKKLKTDDTDSINQQINNLQIKDETTDTKTIEIDSFLQKSLQSVDEKIKLQNRNKFVYEYDENGLKTKESYYDDKGNLEYYDFFQYDTNGSIQKILHYDGNNVLQYYHSYKYNEKGERISANTFDPSGDVLEYY